MATAFLTRLHGGSDGIDDPATAFEFTFFCAYDKAKGEDPPVQAKPRTFHGTLEDCAAKLVRLNRQRYGIYVTVNDTNLRGRKEKDIVRARALWMDDDGEGKPLPLEPHIVVESSPGKRQVYLFIDGLKFDEQRACLDVITTRFGGDPGAKGINRVLRLPGFFHQKDARRPYLVRVIAESGAPPYSRNRVLQAFMVEGLTDQSRAVGKHPSVELPNTPPPPLNEERIRGLCVADSRFANTWAHNRPDLADRSLSGFDLALASCVAASKEHGVVFLWALIRAHREHWGATSSDQQKALRRDYVARTIGASYSNPKRSQPPPRSQTQISSPPGNSEQQAAEKAVPPEITQGPAWPEPLADEAFHGLAGKITRAIAPHSEADDVAILVQLLVAAGNAMGRGPHSCAEADRHGMNLFAVLVGETSKARKGSSWGHAKRIASDADPRWGIRIRSGLSSGEGLIWQVRDPIEKEQRTEENGQARYETVVVDPGVEDKRLLVYESEYASVLKVMRREGNTLSPIIRNAWDTDSLRTLTKNSPAVATGAHISIIGHITKDELLRHLDSTEAGNGFGNRFLWFCARRSKTLPEGGNLRGKDLSPLVAELADTLEWAQASGDFEVKRDDVARAVWRAVYPTLSEGKTGLLGAMLARSEAQVMRIACLYALLDQAQVVRTEHLLAALALWDYVEASASFIFGDALGDPVADAILGAIRGSEMGMTKTEIHAFLGRHKQGSQVDNAIRQLVIKGLARVESEPTNGRAATRIVANSHNSHNSHAGTGRQHAHSYLALAKASIPPAHQLPEARQGPSPRTTSDGDTSPDLQTGVDGEKSEKSEKNEITVNTWNDLKSIPLRRCSACNNCDEKTKFCRVYHKELPDPTRQCRCRHFSGRSPREQR